MADREHYQMLLCKITILKTGSFNLEILSINLHYSSSANLSIVTMMSVCGLITMVALMQYLSDTMTRGSGLNMKFFLLNQGWGLSKNIVLKL